MIELATGGPGSGKTYYAMRRLVAAVEKGRPVATNIELVDDWALRVARRNRVSRCIPGRVRAKARRYERLMFVSGNLEELFRVRLAGTREGRGVMILDEAHNWINGRTWDVDETGSDSRTAKAEAVRRRLAVVRFFSQHRKLGWTVLLITQAEANLDAQVRRLYETHIRLRNLRNFKVMGIRIIPMQFFVAIHVWNDPSKSILKREGYPLSRSIARLYNTMALSHGMEEDDLVGNVTWLPHGTVPAGPGRPDEDEVPGRPDAGSAPPAPDVAPAPPVPEFAAGSWPSSAPSSPGHRLVSDPDEVRSTNGAGPTEA